MRKICHEWQKYLDRGFISGKYWEAFRENAQAASVELNEIKTYAEALPAINRLIDDIGAEKLAAVGGDDSSGLGSLYGTLKQKYQVYTDKFQIAQNARFIDIGISTAEFGVGETGSICVDNYSYEARVTSMLPPVNIVFMNRNNVVDTMNEAFEILEQVFNKGYTGFVTGPSRTSDIERVLTLGVHGPSRLILFAVNGME